VHPWWAFEAEQEGWEGRMRELLVKYPSFGVGECGLDKAKTAQCPLETQLKVFEKQVQMAIDLQRPVSVHCVRAYGALHDAIMAKASSLPSIVLHAWTGSEDMTKSLSKIKNVYFSINPMVIRMKPGKIVPMLKALPPDRCLLESDSPDGGTKTPGAIPVDWMIKLPNLEQIMIHNDIKVSYISKNCNTPTSTLLAAALISAASGRALENVISAAHRATVEVFERASD